jgi:outer membrane biosynthesis protein TonB
MTKRLKQIMQSLCIVLLPILFSCAPQIQQHTEDAVPPPAEPQAEAPVPAAESAAVEPPPAAPESAPAAVPAPVAPESEPVETAPATEELHSYIIKKGDTLWDISNTFFKDPFLWPFIWKANPYVTNPDLIFTGNTLMIPSLTPIERALKAEAAPSEPPMEKKEQAPEAATPGAAAARQKPAEAVEETPAGVSRLIMPEEEIYPIVDKYAMVSAGFVSNEETKDTIVGAAERGKTLLGYDDIVYVSMRDAENIKIGDKYLIYSHISKVKHPKTGKDFGKLIRGRGILQITAKDPAAKVLTARITISFDEIELGNMLSPFVEPTPIYQSAQKKAKDISGYILEVTDRRSINAQSDVVYLDKGIADGVEPGDSFLVYEQPYKKGFPRKMIGETQVFLVKEHTSTAIVKKSSETMGRGYAVDFKQ